MQKSREIILLEGDLIQIIAVPVLYEFVFDSETYFIHKAHNLQNGVVKTLKNYCVSHEIGDN